MNGGDAAVQALADSGVKYAFGIPGIHNLPIFDALARHGGFELVPSRHEQGAAFMADGYSRASGLPGVCLLAAGPGALNAASAASTAYMDSQPLLILAGGVKSTDAGKGVLHEFDQVSVFRPITKSSTRVEDSHSIYSRVRGAFDLSLEGRPRPVFLEVPYDHLSAESTFERTHHPPAAAQAPTPPDELVELMRRSEKVVIIAGGGVVTSGGWNELRALSAALRIPVTTTTMGIGTVVDGDPLSLGRLLTPKAAASVEEADLVLAVGCRFSERSTGFGKLKVKNLVQVDIDPGELGKIFPVRLGICADARAFLKGFLEKAAQAGVGQKQPWFHAPEGTTGAKGAESARHPLDPAEVGSEITSAAGPNAILVTDTGYSFWHTMIQFRADSPRRYLCSAGNAAMGFALPASIGAKLARPESDVIAVVGDGSMMMTGEELIVAAELNIDLTVVIMDDGGYGSIRDYQRRLFASRYFAVDLKAPDFVKLAEAHSASGFRADRLADVGRLIQESRNRGGVSVIDVPITKTENVVPGFLR
ncbi:MAG: thiamine pyrophosphate-binding protein [Thaumarchaeota archaeon]|nr:thiamine pyrophosphate-binding protein [Nitrososphaerota archaeon]